MSINLVSKLTEDTWFYKQPKYQEQLKPFLGKPYISYSTMESWLEYREDFIKEKLVGLPQSFGIYKEFGSYLGQAYEEGTFPKENQYGFVGQENINLEEIRHPNAEYEKLIIIDCGEYFIVGFIDKFVRFEDGVWVNDLKTIGKDKEKKYQGEDYTQVILYSYALEQIGEKIKRTDVLAVRREGSHINPPLKIGKERFYIPLEYNEKRVKFALDKVDKAVKGISEIKAVYDKYFSK